MAIDFYNAADNKIYDSGIKFRPQERFTSGSYEIPTPTPTPVVPGGGITNTNAFMYGGGGGGGALQVGDPMMNFDNYYNYTGNKYMQNQDTPNLDMNYNQKLQSNFMGMPSYQQQELTGADMGEYIGSNTDIPLEQTMAGKIQSGVQGVGKGIKNLMGMLPTPSNFLGKFGIQNFNSLSPADQLFIKTNSGYRGPTVFGENTGGGNVDPFGLNVESLMGNYAEAVRNNFDQLQGTLTKDSRAKDGVTFNEVTGKFESDTLTDVELAAYNKKTNMIRNKFLFRKKQTDQQKKNQRDIDKQNMIEQNRLAGLVGQTITTGGKGGSTSIVQTESGGNDPGTSRPSDHSRSVGLGSNAGNVRSAMNDKDPSTGSAQGYNQNLRSGGRAGYFFGGRVNYKAGGRINFRGGGMDMGNQFNQDQSANSTGTGSSAPGPGDTGGEGGNNPNDGSDTQFGGSSNNNGGGNKTSIIDKIRYNPIINNPITRMVGRLGLYSVNPSLMGLDYRTASQLKGVYDKATNGVDDDDVTLSKYKQGGRVSFKNGGLASIL